MNPEPKRLYRSETNRIFFGVLGGFGEYFNIDPTILRAIWIAVIAITAFIPGIIAYFLSILVIPRRPRELRIR